MWFHDAGKLLLFILHYYVEKIVLMDVKSNTARRCDCVDDGSVSWANVILLEKVFINDRLTNIPWKVGSTEFPLFPLPLEGGFCQFCRILLIVNLLCTAVCTDSRASLLGKPSVILLIDKLADSSRLCCLPTAWHHSWSLQLHSLQKFDSSNYTTTSFHNLQISRHDLFCFPVSKRWFKNHFGF